MFEYFIRDYLHYLLSIRKVNVAAAVSVHSYGPMILYPWSDKVREICANIFIGKKRKTVKF